MSSPERPNLPPVVKNLFEGLQHFLHTSDEAVKKQLVVYSLLEHITYTPPEVLDALDTEITAGIKKNTITAGSAAIEITRLHPVALTLNYKGLPRELYGLGYSPQATSYYAKILSGVDGGAENYINLGFKPDELRCTPVQRPYGLSGNRPPQGVPTFAPDTTIL